MKKVWLVTAIFLCVLLAVWRYNEAKAYAWRLRNHTPTTSVKASRDFGIFDSAITTLPAEFNLGGESYRVAQAWLEHRTYAGQIGPLITTQQIAPELILCVDIRPVARPNETPSPPMRIKNADLGTFHYAAKNSVLFTTVGHSLPDQIILISHKDGAQVELKLKFTRKE